MTRGALVPVGGKTGALLQCYADRHGELSCHGARAHRLDPILDWTWYDHPRVSASRA